MLAQGKAKLCALNPDNPMTASLLALGAAQKTENFVRQNEASGTLLKKIRNALKLNLGDNLSSAILLNPDTLSLVASAATSQNNSIKIEMSLDFFFITSAGELDEAKVEASINPLLPPDFPIRISCMTLDRTTLLGMFTENENEAGLAAYGMLHEGLILSGFENFYILILEAFARKLGI
jgi:hypothetical protein